MSDETTGNENSIECPACHETIDLMDGCRVDHPVIVCEHCKKMIKLRAAMSVMTHAAVEEDGPKKVRITLEASPAKRQALWIAKHGFGYVSDMEVVKELLLLPGHTIDAVRNDRAGDVVFSHRELEIAVRDGIEIRPRTS